MAGLVGPVGELGFELLDGGEGTLELGGEGVGDAVGRDADRLGDVAQGVFDDEAVRAAAEEEADGGGVLRGAQEVVDGRAVEVELAGVLGTERAHLQVDDDVAVELDVVEDEVDEEVVLADREVVLAAEEGEADAELEHEILQMVQQSALEVTLVGGGVEGEEIEVVGVFEQVLGEV